MPEAQIDLFYSNPLIPSCRNCGALLLRWGWYESESEPVEYWYCPKCDIAGREPCIQVFPTRKGATNEHR